VIDSRPLRIAIFSEVYWPMVSGVGVTLHRLTDALQARGHAVRVYSPSYPLPPETKDRPEVFRVPGVPFFLYPDVQFALPRQGGILEDARAFNPDLVHVATEFSMGVTGIKVAKALGIPAIASAHTDYEQYASRYYKVGWAIRAGSSGISTIEVLPTLASGVAGSIRRASIPASAGASTARPSEPGSRTWW